MVTHDDGGGGKAENGYRPRGFLGWGVESRGCSQGRAFERQWSAPAVRTGGQKGCYRAVLGQAFPGAEEVGRVVC